MKIIPRPSPNFGARRGQSAPDLVVLHYTAMKTPEAALQRLCTPKFEVSAHYLIDESGHIFQMVHESQRAWHAGAGAWSGKTDVNSASIGIELANLGNTPFSAPLMSALEFLLADILSRYKIPPERVIAHSDCAPGRKCDPGPRFDWQRLARQGLSIWPNARPVAPDKHMFLSHLYDFGYMPQASYEYLLQTLRLRFRPGAEGGLAPEDMGIASYLAKHYSIDRQSHTS